MLALDETRDGVADDPVDHLEPLPGSTLRDAAHELLDWYNACLKLALRCEDPFMCAKVCLQTGHQAGVHWCTQDLRRTFAKLAFVGMIPRPIPAEYEIREPCGAPILDRDLADPGIDSMRPVIAGHMKHIIQSPRTRQAIYEAALTMGLPLLDGMNMQNVAAMFGVHHATISNACKHLTREIPCLVGVSRYMKSAEATNAYRKARFSVCDSRPMLMSN